jgi:acyl-ACP thioesterase
MEALVPIPAAGRTFAASRRIRLADRDARGRVRLDAVARLLQDIAIDDVDETGWGAPEHLWFVRTIRMDVVRPLLADRAVDLVTWCSGTAALAAGRRWSVAGDAGGLVEVDSVWIHLDRNGAPARLEDFGTYGAAAAGRRVSTRTELPEPPDGSRRVPFPLRVSDVDPNGHVNNAVYWQAVEHLLAGAELDLRSPLRARLDFRLPIDLGEELELVVDATAERLHATFDSSGRTKAVALVEQL